MNPKNGFRSKKNPSSLGRRTQFINVGQMTQRRKSHPIFNYEICFDGIALIPTDYTVFSREIMVTGWNPGSFSRGGKGVGGQKPTSSSVFVGARQRQSERPEFTVFRCDKMTSLARLMTLSIKV